MKRGRQERDELKEREKRFGLCQSQHLTFCGSGGDCFDCAAQAGVLSECVRCTPGQTVRHHNIAHQAVCLFRCVRNFLTSGFKLAQSLH